MINIKIFEFNPIRVNTYIIYNESKECIIVDPGCYYKNEENELSGFIEKELIKPVRLINTHTHTDHIMGNNYIIKKYSLPVEIHIGAEYFLKNAKNWGEMLGFNIEDIQSPLKYLNDGDIINFGNSELEVAYTPGHADGSICLINKKQKFVISGDVLFAGSIGRTDLPSGDFDILEKSIKEKLYILDDGYIVYPGHGPTTTIGEEKHNNPFVHL